MPRPTSACACCDGFEWKRSSLSEHGGKVQLTYSFCTCLPAVCVECVADLAVHSLRPAQANPLPHTHTLEDGQKIPSTAL